MLCLHLIEGFLLLQSCACTHLVSEHFLVKSIAFDPCNLWLEQKKCWQSACRRKGKMSSSVKIFKKQQIGFCCLWNEPVGRIKSSFGMPGSVCHRTKTFHFTSTVSCRAGLRTHLCLKGWGGFWNCSCREKFVDGSKRWMWPPYWLSIVESREEVWKSLISHAHLRMRRFLADLNGIVT